MIDTHNSYFIILISGVALFLYGMGLASSSLEKLMAGKKSTCTHTYVDRMGNGVES